LGAADTAVTEARWRLEGTNLIIDFTFPSPGTITLEARVQGSSLFLALSKSFESTDGAFVGFDNYLIYFTTPTLFASLQNSLTVAAVSTAIVVPLAFAYAYALTRTRLPAKGLFYALALLPIFAPSLLAAISLVYIFGNQGFLGFLLMGHSIYGPSASSWGRCSPHFPMRC
jgi:iron(III) transport system permease protein